MDDDKAEQTHGRAVECPHCRERFWIDFGVEITGVRQTARTQDRWRELLTDAERAWLEQAQAAGVLESFETAVRARTGGQSPPGNVEKFLMTFMRASTPLQPRRDQHERLLKEWGADYRLWQGHGVVAIVAGGLLRAFAPAHWLLGLPVKNASGKLKGRVVDQSHVEHWIRTRFGYVPNGAATASLLRAKSIGAFGRLVQ